MRLPSMPSMNDIKVMGQQAYQWTAGQVKSLSASYAMNNKMYLLRYDPFVRTSALVVANIVFTKLVMKSIPKIINSKLVKYIDTTKEYTGGNINKYNSIIKKIALLTLPLLCTFVSTSLLKIPFTRKIAFISLATMGATTILLPNKKPSLQFQQPGSNQNRRKRV